MLHFLNFFYFENKSIWIFIFIFILIIISIDAIDIVDKKNQNRSKNKILRAIETFVFTPWNMGTRFYPSYDIRGYPPMFNNNIIGATRGYSYPLIFPWNYPFPGSPYLYFSPYFYEANGKYTVDQKYANSLAYNLTRPLRT